MASKRAFDVVFALCGLPFVALLACVVACGNLFANPGPLMFRQTRAGRGGAPFTIYKFRTMLPAGNACRGPEDPVELNRITPFGAFMRRTRIDETPQLLNILLGEMSLVGPRPDAIEHAHHFARTVPLYQRRWAMRPGITGYAQVCSGYAEGAEHTMQKVAHDVVYIRHASWRLELTILLRTFGVIVTGRGAI